ncbi:bifunctional 3,4-dihydroxy-2-butanone-4-phosphate synthase/GTP cyclohydrolase II [Sinimarinibacterium sp. NLF-5-8]|uniref:bifunctional 3,4-dihydroxy-2-butanone-4-phosphate synthase/GTP cyclohydrolase II n=1 Tax=Sinimarinibacterium sp. NLF-5-8 TaxID=2698684 RepID=UPI00137BF845|nr:bifunctional 3,4-dihydroxy-2-butanone-4-phosphate synthase/GTP cyclohydrolase II [Sinimarinibacterium sp. NLF-5-8]QHS09893.1 3,4-dihydroxy-2-butanone-4-phosphate synthase [Sinimarinibacterium sp. NLF-5-8]
MSTDNASPRKERPLDTPEAIIADIRAGKMVILMDDEDRENEGDIVMAAELVRPEDINFMARYGRGLICLTLTQERCRQLRLPQMVSQNEERHKTAFTVSIEAASGVTTGISAHDRAHTVRTAVKPGARPEDLVQPGHIFPLMAQPGGVLTRAGHTEAGCDLARLARLTPAAVIVEVLNEDGTMARRPDLEKFADLHGLKLGTIADLIRYRLDNEHTVERVNETHVETEFGQFRLVTYQDTIDNTIHLAMVKGEVQTEKPTLVRVHVRNMLQDVLGVQHGDFSWPLRQALKRVADEGEGVVVVLRKPEAPRELMQQIVALNQIEADAAATDSRPMLRTYGIGAQILSDLGVRKMRVLSAPRRMQGISGFGLEIVEYVSPSE